MRVAIIGTGPGGFYTADALLKSALESGLDLEIDLIDRLPTPFGLIRGGVAPDHQTTKRVIKAYDRTAQNERVRFYGNVELGKDVSLDALKALYDAVVLSIGSPLDRPLGIPGEDKKGVFGAAAFVGWYNGHPDFRSLDPDLSCSAAAVIGNGNVAIDIARVLVKTPAEMAETDLPDYAAQAIHKGGIKDVYMFGRRGPIEAKFTNVELREMGNLSDSHPVVDPADLPDSVEGDWSPRDRRLRERNLETLREFTALDPAGKSKRVHFAFYAKPVEILGGDRVEALRLERTAVEGGRARGTGEFFEVDCGLVLPAIGYQAAPVEGLPFDTDNGVIVNDDGHVEDGVYCAGWVKRGPTGVIGTNKPDGDIVAQRILGDLGNLDDLGAGKEGRRGLETLLDGKGLRYVTYEDWQKIDEAEISTATKPAPRRKFVAVEEMLDVLVS
ncbi:MAG: FAD-dependent oxidoreductase [Proteobacteria bacterium]|nr:FAD-dependent oxidoreductase [Pseudomonadota bacterium]